MKILIATGNKGKIREMNELFSDMPVEFVGIDTLEEVPEVVEDGSTFHENALKKAMTFYNRASMPVLAEDSGLEVEALEGAPGIYSARYAGAEATDEDNIRKLLDALKGVPPEQRRARFVSVLCFVLDGKPHFFEGEVEGWITDRPSGSYGFGYDPVFVPDGYDKTFAELGPEIKNRISHRAKAIAKFKEFLKGLLAKE